MSTAIPKATQTVAGAAKSGAKEGRMAKFLKNEGLGRVLEVAAENPNVCQAGFALGICCVMRPASNYAVTKDKKDAWFANAQSMSSGVIGFGWPLVFATPLAAGVKHVLAHPQKYLKPELIKKFYPNIGMTEEIAKDGTKIKKIATNIKGEMLRKDGSVLCKELEPLMIYGEENQVAFEKMYPAHYVERGTNVVRIKPVQKEDGSWKYIKTEKGMAKYKLDGDKSIPIGQAIQAKNFAVDSEGVLRYPKKDNSGKPLLDKDKKLVLGDMVDEKDFTPITEEMEIGALKEKNVQTAINMSSDTLLAPFRASLTIALIPSILGFFGIEKPKKAPGQNQNNSQSLNIVSTSNNTAVKAYHGGRNASSFSAFKKGGV